MTINKAKSSSYASVAPEWTASYIADYSNKTHDIIMENYSSGKLSDCNKAQLNAIAAELETVYKRLNYIINGQY